MSNFIKDSDKFMNENEEVFKRYIIALALKCNEENATDCDAVVILNNGDRKMRINCHMEFSVHVEEEDEDE